MNPDVLTYEQMLAVFERFERLQVEWLDPQFEKMRQSAGRTSNKWRRVWESPVEVIAAPDTPSAADAPNVEGSTGSKSPCPTRHQERSATGSLSNAHKVTR